MAQSGETRTAPLRVAVIGAAGRMGKLLVDAIDSAPDLVLAARIDPRPLLPEGAPAAPGPSAGRAASAAHSPSTAQGASAAQGASSAHSPSAPQGSSATPGPSTSSLFQFVAGGVDVAVEFTTGEAPAQIGREIERLGCAWVSGTTGLTPQSKEALKSAARTVAVLSAPNMSLGVALVSRLLRTAARLLPEEWEMELTEVHHGGKVDAPSGTALSLAEIWTGVRGGERIQGRSGKTGPRPKGQVGIHALRLPEGVGEHRVYLGSPFERIELAHHALDRAAFVSGAVTALRWLAGKPAGSYTLDDWIEDRLR